MRKAATAGPLKRAEVARPHKQSPLSSFWELPSPSTPKAASRAQSVLSMKTPTSAFQDTGQSTAVRQRSAKTTAFSAPTTSQVITVDDNNSPELECIAVAQKTPRSTLASSSSSRRAAVAQRPAVVLIGIDDTDDDDDFIKILRKRKQPSSGNVVMSNGSSNVQPAQPKVARKRSIEEICLPSSSPLLRHGSPTVERHNSQLQHPADGTISSSTIADPLLSQETLVANMSRTNTASSSAIAMHHLELIASKASAQQYRHTASASKEALKGVDAELFDDPIDEFLTQDVAAGLLTAVSQSNKNKSQCNRSSSSSPVQPGTSQWYHDNHDIYIGVGGDSQKPMDIRQDPGQEHANESYVSESYANESYASVDDGDSPPQSPLEGFCDLRVFSGTGGGDMDIYLNQFGPTVRDTSQQPGGSRDRSRGGRRGRGGARSHPRSSSSSNSSGLTRGGRRGRGRGRGPVQQATAAGFGGIRPVTSARALAPAVTTPIIYNHYADDGYLDIAPSLNWEGGGMSRFG